MKHLLLLIIRIYWIVVPESKRKQCIFRESCSRYVWRITKTEGFRAGIRAFKFRNRHCCPGYAIYKHNNHYELKTANGLILKEDEIDERLLTTDNPSLIDFDNPALLQNGNLRLKL